jgi:ATP-binding cassette subfamily B protein
MSSPKRLRDFLAPHKGSLATGGLLLVATNGFEKAIPWMLKVGVDAFSHDDVAAVLRVALWVGALAAAMMLTRTASRVFVFNIGRDVEYELRQALLTQLHRLGASFLTKVSTGDLMSRATNDLAQVRLLLGFGTLNVINATVAWVSALALMFAISPRLAVFALIPYPFFMLATRFFVRRLFHVSQENQIVLAKLAERAQEYLSGVRAVRAFSADALESERFAQANREAVQRTMSLVTLRGMMSPVLMGISSLGTLIVIYVGGTMIDEGTLTKGELLAFYAYLMQLVWPTMAAGYILSILQRGRAAFVRVREVLETEPDITEAANAQHLSEQARNMPGRGSLDVQKLSFAYDGRTVLDDVSFSVPQGQKLAIVGRTGSGKTTLAALLSRLLPTPAETVRLDGLDITQLALADVRKAVGYAQQEPFLFSTTIGRNIGFSLGDTESELASSRIRNVAREAAVLEEIERLPNAFDTVVGERGVQLSGGQKQRVALARALLNDPAVLVLDDPLSAVDAKTERTILDALDRAASGRTLILITNRTAAAARCDRILVLDQGRLTEEGTHLQLLARRGFYAELCKRQSLEQELSAL